MSLDPETLRQWPLQPITRSYDQKDAMLYALGLGIGQNPVDPVQLQFVYEGQLRALPTMCAVIGFPGPWLSDPATGVDYSRVVHGEQHLVMTRPLPVAAELRCENHVVDVVDRGRDRGAAIYVACELYDVAAEVLIARQTSVLIARGDGGFDAEPVASPISQLPNVPDREPDLHFDWPVPPQLALIYRLSGDRNPLHAVPDIARSAGFDRPILHGLASFGIAGFVAIATICGGNPELLREIGVRFSAPVIPGETLRFEVWRVAQGEALFRARAIERDRVVLNNGRIRHAAVNDNGSAEGGVS